MATKFPSITSPRHTAGYCKNLTEAEEFKGTTKYKYQLRVAKEDLGNQVDWYEGGKKVNGSWKDFFDTLEAFHVQAGGDPAIKNPVKDGDKVKKKSGKDKGKPAMPGFLFVNLSSKKKPKQLNGKGEEIKQKALQKSGAWGGDTVRVSFWPGVYDDGIFVSLQQVQVLSLGERHQSAGSGGSGGGFVDTGDYDGGADETGDEDETEDNVDTSDEEDDGSDY